MPWWGRAAAQMPRAANAAANAPWLAAAGKRMLGLAPERDAPRFATETFRAWFARRPAEPAAHQDRGRVLLWPDTFSDLFEPAIGRAAVDVLEAAGFAPELPPRRLCCGRPLYDFG